ncbi:MAG TPA: C45 family peptidase [Rhizomicrobium sp.]|nr:C45 family peptidase [Rhizomicrobium sp.]
MDTNNLQVFEFNGTPQARGRQHGETLRPRIAELLQRWGEGVQRTHGLTPQDYARRFFTQTRFRQSLQCYAPDVLTEVVAIAEAANVDADQLLAFQHVNEEFWYDPNQAGEACSTIALGRCATQPTLVAQNLDLDSYLDGYQILMRYNCDRSDGRILVLSVPGMISLNGMNDFGFAVCDNTLVQLRTNPAGVPIFAIYRLLLECKTVAEARRLLAELPHASGLNWVTGDPTEVCMLESSAGSIVPHTSDDRSKPIFHTNHPMWSTDLTPDRLQSWAQGARVRPSRSSYLRLAALQERLGGLRGTLTMDQIKIILSSKDDPDYPVSRGGGSSGDDIAIGFTLACCIFELDAAEPKLHIAAGPPDHTEFRTFLA